jgi:hypothetical protein
MITRYDKRRADPKISAIWDLDYAKRETYAEDSTLIGKSDAMTHPP